MRSSDGDGALVIFGAILGVLGMLALIWLSSLDGKSIKTDSKLNIAGRHYRVLTVDDSALRLNSDVSVSTITISVNKLD